MSGATHIVHHYVPGQPFYIRELVYREVKPLMVANGVRLNDFGVVARANRYYDADGKTVAANNSHFGAIVQWLAVCFVIGAPCYVLIDVWASACLGSRIFRKYLSKHKGKAE